MAREVPYRILRSGLLFSTSWENWARARGASSAESGLSSQFLRFFPLEYFLFTGYSNAAKDL